MLDYVIRCRHAHRRDRGRRGPGRRGDPGRPDRRRRRWWTNRPRRSSTRPGLMVAPGDRRPPHALRRPAVLGPRRVALERPRRDDGDRRELRVHPGPHQRRGRRLHPPHDGQGRGDAPGRSGTGRAVELVDVRRVPRLTREPARRQRRLPRRPLRAGRKVLGAAHGEEVATDEEIDAMRALFASPSRPEASGSPRRSRAPTATATGGSSAPTTPTAARCWPSPKRWRRMKAPRSSTSPTGASTRSATRRSTS